MTNKSYSVATLQLFPKWKQFKSKVPATSTISNLKEMRA